MKRDFHRSNCRPAGPSAAPCASTELAPCQVHHIWPYLLVVRMSGMRVHVVSDVHGRADALARAGDGADALICLGDLILFVDYEDHSQGIFAELFGAER